MRQLAHEPGWWGVATASHEIEAAPGFVIFLHGTHDGKSQTIRLEDSEVDELTRQLHKAKKIARKQQ